MYERVLVPTDGSEGSTVAIDHALDLARTYGATLEALYVVDTANVSTEVTGGAVIEAMERTGRKAVDAVAERAAAAGVDCDGEIARGTPHRAILDHAEESGADLIVMGTHGRTGLTRYLLGSVTEKIVRLSEVPVLTVRIASDRESARTGAEAADDRSPDDESQE